MYAKRSWNSAKIIASVHLGVCAFGREMNWDYVILEWHIFSSSRVSASVSFIILANPALHLLLDLNV